MLYFRILPNTTAAMTSLVTPLSLLAPVFDLQRYKSSLKPKNVSNAPHPVIGKIYTGESVTSVEISDIAADKEQLWQYLTGLFRVLPWYASTAFATTWEGEATANGISLATKVVHAIAPLPEPLFFYALTVLYRPVDEGGLDFTSAGSPQQTAEEIDGDWFNTISAFVADLIRYRNLGVDGRVHTAGNRLYALGLAFLKQSHPKRKVFEDHVVIDAVHDILLGEQTITSVKSKARVAQAA